MDDVFDPKPSQLTQVEPDRVARLSVQGSGFALVGWDPSKEQAFVWVSPTPSLIQIAIKSFSAFKGMQIKAIGSEELIKQISMLFSQIEAKLSAQLVIKGSEIIEAYFYGKTGRLRASQTTPSTPQNQQKETENRKIRTLIVDDSRTIRNLLTKIMASDPIFEVVGSTGNPLEVESLIATTKPDLITLDVQMPGMDGVELLERYLPRFLIPTVMISSLTLAESDQILNALQIGAVDYIQKPSIEEIREHSAEMLERLKTAARSRVIPKQKEGQDRVRLKEGEKMDQSKFIAIGSSTGGTEALQTVLTQLPAEIPPILIVQHIPPVFSKALACRLDDLCPFEVLEAEDGMAICPGKALIAPGGKQMRIDKQGSGWIVRIEDTPPVNRHKPSVDYLFDSVATHLKTRAVGVILTGMGADGAKGLLKMRQTGARTLAQDEATSVVFGMPKAAIEAGAVEEVVPLQQVSQVLANWLTKKAAA